MSEQQTQEGCAQMGAVCEAHKRLEPFAGTFKAEVKMWMGPGDPMVSTGTMVNTMDLGGRYLRQEYQGDASEGPFPNFAGRGFWGYNTVANKYEGFWIDSASTFMQTEAGDVDDAGRIWTMVGEMINPQTQQPLKKRSVISLLGKDRHSMEMYFAGPDGNEVKTMEIQYQRA